MSCGHRKLIPAAVTAAGPAAGTGAAAAAGTALIACVAGPDRLPAAIAAGADLVDLGVVPQAAVAAFAAAHPRTGFCAEHPQATAVRSARLARATGALLICPDPAAARTAGLPASQLLVLVPPAGVSQALQAGWQPLVDADLAAAGHGPGALIAAIALSGWLGAAAVRTSQVAAARRALDMTASIAGRRAPARALRGLA